MYISHNGGFKRIRISDLFDLRAMTDDELFFMYPERCSFLDDLTRAALQEHVGFSFSNADDSPWDALQRMVRFMEVTREGSQVEVSRKMVDIVPPHWKVLDYLPPESTDDCRGDIRVEGRARIWGGEGLKTDERSYMQGPLVVGKNLKLRNVATLIGPVFMGEGMKVGQGCRIKEAIFLSGDHSVFASHLNRCVAGRNVRIGKGVLFEDESLDGSLRNDWAKKYPNFGDQGAIIGDNCRIQAGAILGQGVVLMPGTLVDKGTVLEDHCLYEGVLVGRPDSGIPIHY